MLFQLLLLSLTLQAQAGPPLPIREHPGLRPMEDCNGNGLADARDIFLGTSADCQGDGVPDECQTAVAYSYSYDDGSMEGAVGTNHDYVAWMSSHLVQTGHETITEVEVAWGAMDPGTPAVVALWSDPNGDGDPTDALLLSSRATASSLEFSGTRVSVDVPDVFVGPAGTSFFVGVYGQFDQSSFPAGLDDTKSDQTSWWISSDSPIDPNDLDSGLIAEFGLIASVCPCDGDWTVRALFCPTGHCGESGDVNANSVPDECEPDCNGNGLPDDFDVANGANDCEGDGVPDDCQGYADCDSNGVWDICQALTPEGLSGEYYPNRELQGAPFARIDPGVVFDFDLAPPFPGQIPADDFSARWTGSITTGAAGTYTFGVLHDDGARLWVNGALLVDAWVTSGAVFDTGAVDLDAFTEYPVRLEYFEASGNAVVELHWQPPGGGMAPMLPAELEPVHDRDDDGIPDSCQFDDCNANGVDDVEDIAFGNSVDCDGDVVPDECQPCEDCDGNGLLDSCELVPAQGLAAQYWTSDGLPGNFSNRRVVQIDPNIDFDWGTGPPLPGLPTEDFTIRWTGSLTTPAVTGTYTFHVQADDGVRFWLDGVLLVDEWHPSAGTTYDVNADLAAGSRHVVQFDYYEASGDALVHLDWTVPGASRVPVPPSALSPDTDVDGDTVPDICTTDCDLDGVPDAVELLLGTSFDADGNCVPDLCDAGSGYWRFEERSGTTVLDATANGLDGTTNGLPFRTLDVPVDPIPLTQAGNGSALDLDWQSTSSGGSATVADPAGFLSMGASSFTIEAWVKLDQVSDTSDPSQRQWLCQKKPTATSDAFLDYGFLVQAGPLGATGRELAFRYGDGANASGVTSTLTIDDQDWHYVSVAYDASASALRFGIDDVTETVTLVKPNFENNGPLLLGAHENGSGVQNQYLRGSIDEVRVTRVFLAPGQLLAAEE